MWLKLDDAFEDNPKVSPLSDAAHRLHVRALTWSCKRENRHTEGFIPTQLLSSISRNLPTRKLKKLVQELVDATVGGTKDFGLWEEVDGGYQIHDWHQFQPDDRDQPAMTRSESASIAGKKSAEARRQRTGTAQPPRPERPRTSFERSEGRSTEPTTPNEPRTSRTPVPVPVSEPSEGGAEELEGRSSNEDPERPPRAVGSVVRAAHDGTKHITNFERSFLPTKQATEFPDDFEPSPENEHYATSKSLDITDEISSLRSHARSQGKISCAWHEELNIWMRRSDKFKRERGSRGGTRQQSAKTGWE